MMSTKNTALIVAPSLNQYNTSFEKIIFANEVINLSQQAYKLQMI